MLKLLRHRFSGAAQGASPRASATGSNADGEQYAPEQAMDEYRALAAMWEEQKKLQRTQAMEWQCCSCGLRFPVD